MVVFLLLFKNNSANTDSKTLACGIFENAKINIQKYAHVVNTKCESKLH